MFSHCDAGSIAQAGLDSAQHARHVAGEALLAAEVQQRAEEVRVPIVALRGCVATSTRGVQVVVLLRDDSTSGG